MNQVTVGVFVVQDLFIYVGCLTAAGPPFGASVKHAMFEKFSIDGLAAYWPIRALCPFVLWLCCESAPFSSCLASAEMVEFVQTEACW